MCICEYAHSRKVPKVAKVDDLSYVLGFFLGWVRFIVVAAVKLPNNQRILLPSESLFLHAPRLYANRNTPAAGCL